MNRICDVTTPGCCHVGEESEARRALSKAQACRGAVVGSKQVLSLPLVQKLPPPHEVGRARIAAGRAVSKGGVRAFGPMDSRAPPGSV